MHRGVSVIIPVYNGEQTIAACLSAVVAQTYGGPIEIIVVDNDSMDHTRDLIKGYDRVRLISCTRPGPAAARNDGIKEARYNLLAFTDADCIPQPTWLAELVVALKPELSGVGGPLASASSGLISDYVAEVSFRQADYVGASLPYLATSNVLYRRAALEEIGGLDEGFDIAGGEDNDLGWRLTQNNFSLGFAPAAICLHQHPTTLINFVTQRLRYGYGEALLLKKHRGLDELKRQVEEQSRLTLWVYLCLALRRHFARWIVKRDRRASLAAISELSFFCGYLIGNWRGLAKHEANTSYESDSNTRDPAPPMCIKPWTSFEFDDQNGNVLPCCWTTMKVGNVNQQSVAEIWNGTLFQTFRQKMIDGDYEDICPRHCPHRAGYLKEELPPAGRSGPFSNNVETLKREIAERRTRLEGFPVAMRLVPSIRCNLECIMCWQRVEKERELPDSFYAELTDLLPTVSSMVLQGGEPLMIKRCRDLLKSCKSDKYPDLQFGLITNGTFLSEQFLSLVDRVNMQWLFVSLDAATAQTYRRIRGGVFDDVLEGIRRVTRQRPEIHMIIGFVVMNENVRELVSFIRLAEELGVEFEFSPLNAAFKKGNDFGSKEFRGRLAAAIDQAEMYMSAVGLRNSSLDTVKERMKEEEASGNLVQLTRGA